MTPKKQQLLDDNSRKESLLTERDIPHDELLTLSASNVALRRQGKEYDRLLGGQDPEEDLDDPFDDDQGSEQPPTDDPLADQSKDPEETEDDESDSENFVLPPIQLGERHDPDPIAPPSSAYNMLDNEPVPFILQAALDRAVDELKEAEASLLKAEESEKGLKRSIEVLKTQLKEADKHSAEATSLQAQLSRQKTEHEVLTKDLSTLQTDQAELRKKLSGHQIADDPNQIVCQLKTEHDQEFVPRAVSRWWMWGCLGCAAALLITVIVWIVVSLNSGRSTVQQPSQDSSSYFDTPAIKAILEKK